MLNPISLPSSYPYDPYFSSNTSDVAEEMNTGYQLVFNESGYLNVVLRNGKLVTLTKKTIIPAGEHYYHATLDSDGILTQYAHPKTLTNGRWVRNWFTVWSVPNDICFNVTGDLGGGPCGFNIYRRLDKNKRPICECLPGFSLFVPTNKFSGCKQLTTRNCEQRSTMSKELYEMKEVHNTFWPTSANYEQLLPISEDECSLSCLNDCNCVVAVISEGSYWKKKLPLSNGRKDYNSYGKALIKVPKFNVSTDETSGNPEIRKKD